MKRRNFIQLGAITGAIPFLGVKACAPISNDANDSENPSSEEPFELEEWTVEQFQKAMEDGKYSSKEICELYLKRIEQKDQSDGGLNSVIAVNPEALSIADQLDNERAEGKVRGPLHGIPVMIKDNIDTGDKMMTTAGSLALVGSTAPDDAFIVKKLREAGAVLLGKTNLSEWANFRSTRSSSGWSGRGRQTRNPFALDRNPCGSSSGSGAAVSGNMCALTIGTETNGSIVCPSSSNGVVGIKPTVGLWSRDGIIPISETQDTAGPMGRTVADAASLLGACVGVDESDPRTSESDGNNYTDYTQFLDANALQGKKIGILDGVFGYHERVDEVFEKVVEVLEAQGAEVVKDIKVSESG
ncbi:MAG: amidase family protein, partial [Bacteroidota bacterium]